MVRPTTLRSLATLIRERRDCLNTLPAFVARVNSAMWQDPWTFPAVNYALEAWILPLGTGAMGNNVNSQFASTGNNAGGTGIAFRTKYIPAEYDPENPEVVLVPEVIELRLVTFEAGISQETQPVTVPKTKWTHVAAVNDAGSLQLYINGVATGDPLSFDKASMGPAYVGGGNDTANPFHGYMDEIRYSTFEAGKFLPSDLLTRAPGPQILTQPAATSVWEGGAAPFEIGIAYDDGSDGDVDLLLRNADLAMYEAKANGRNQAVTFGDAIGL
ncbi:MAG: hypothetical protein EOO81_13250, partial [Oxalobacteraceae bacterium]